MADSPRRLTLVITSLEAGGAERVMSQMANLWAAEGRAVTLITLHHNRQDFYQLDPRVTRLALDILAPSSNPAQALVTNIGRIKTLRSAIRESQPDAVIAFTDQTNVMTLVATRRLGVPVVVSERIDPRAHDIGPLWSAARKRSYRWAARVVVQTESVRQWCTQFVPAERLTIIPNPISDVYGDDERPAPSWLHAQTPFVAAMGSLVERKGFTTLLRAFAALGDAAERWNLVVMGEGPQRSELETLAKRLGIASHVHLPGLVAQPGPVLSRAAMFVLSSTAEGFPNALIEAMACGCACISTDCQSGPAEIIDDGVNGLLVPVGDVAALTNAMRRLIAEPARRATLGAEAERVRERFAPASILHQWSALLESIR